MKRDLLSQFHISELMLENRFSHLLFRISLIMIFIASDLVSADAILSASQSQLERPTTSGGVEAEPQIVITEIHHSPGLDSARAEFVELQNAGPNTVNLQGWAIDGAVYYVIADNIELRPNERVVIAQDPQTISQLWGSNAIGPYQGRLNGEGEEIILRQPNALEADTVHYQLGFPWPTVGDLPSLSINLISPSLDNSRGGHWRSATPTPGYATAVAFATPPLVENVLHLPGQPGSNQQVIVEATVADPDSVDAVELDYQIVEPGSYIAQDDPEYQSKWISIPMVATGDSNASGGVYQATIPQAVQVHRRLIRYRVRAVNGLGEAITVPYSDDPQPNFAYFVYDGVPPWQGAIRPKRPGSVEGTVLTYDFRSMRPVAVYHLITKEDDFRKGLVTSGYEGSDYPWQGTLVYGDHVYDHIRYRARGGVWRYAMGKNHPKFAFNRGHDFQAHDDFGQPYPVKWRKLNLSSVIQRSDRLHRGEQGMFESVGFRLFNLAGVEAPLTHFVHLRAIMRADETPAHTDHDAQYDTDFHGLYLAIEQMGGRFLDQHGLPDGNLYKMEDGTGELDNQGANSVSDKSDLNRFLAEYNFSNPTTEWWQANVDLPRFYSYRSIVEAIHHYDINKLKNYFYYHNPETGLWQVHPWDIDQTWADNMFGTGYDELVRVGILRRPQQNIAYQNRLREILDLIFNSDQGWKLLDEQAALINTPANGLSMVDADRSMWDYNPIMDSDSVDAQKGGVALFYQSSPTSDFEGMVGLMKNWIVNRGEWITEQLIEDEHKIPHTPTAIYTGSPDYPADNLRFRHGGYRDPQGGDTFAAVQWRIAPIHHPAVPNYDPERRNRYEVQASWQSNELATHIEEVMIPAGACLTGQTCRVRVRMKDVDGFWSHWSAPVEFVAGQPELPPTDAIKPTELMFHALSHGAIPGAELDFIELTNIGDEPINLSGMSITGGITHTFPFPTVLQPQNYFVLAENSQRFADVYGFAPQGQFTGKLSNNGEIILLSDVFGRSIFRLDYGTGNSLPVLVQGQGHSLVFHPSSARDVADLSAWRASTTVGGSPGADDPVPVVINEVLANPLESDERAIELWNPTGTDAAIGGWYLTRQLSQPAQYQIPAGTVVPSHAYWTVSGEHFTQRSDHSAGLALAPDGGALFLLSTDGNDRLTGYRHKFAYGAAEPGTSFGRFIDYQGEEKPVPQRDVTLGTTNGEPLVGPLVFSRIHLHPDASREFVELTNSSSSEVLLANPGQPDQRWRMGGIHFQFPSGVSVPPGGKILLSASAPQELCQSDTYEMLIAMSESRPFATDQSALRVLGPYQGGLSNKSGTLSLARPAWRNDLEQTIYVNVETIRYKTVLPWPTMRAEDEGHMLERASAGYGDDPSAWTASPIADVSTTGQSTTICSFEAAYDDLEKTTEIRWVTFAEENIEGYNLWLSQNLLLQSATRLTDEIVPAKSLLAENADLSSQSYLVRIPADLDDAGNNPHAIYVLEVVGQGGEVVEVIQTSPQVELTLQYLPIVTQD